MSRFEQISADLQKQLPGLKGFSYGKIKTADRVYLSKDEMQCMADKKFEIDRLGQARDVFLFC